MSPAGRISRRQSNPHVAYDYTPPRSGHGPLDWLGKWKGFLHALPPEKLPNYLPDAWKRDLMAEQQAAPSDHHANMARAAVR